MKVVTVATIAATPAKMVTMFAKRLPVPALCKCSSSSANIAEVSAIAEALHSSIQGTAIGTIDVSGQRSRWTLGCVKKMSQCATCSIFSRQFTNRLDEANTLLETQIKRHEKDKMGEIR